MTLGYRVGHNQGDLLGPTCDAIANTLEDHYVALDQQHPRSAWILTVSANTTAWLDSVRSHVQRVANARDSRGTRWRPPKHEAYLDCRFFGCALGLPRRPRAMEAADRGRRKESRAKEYIRIDAATRTVDSRDMEKLRVAMVQYQTGLLAYFRGRAAIVDVRAKYYVGLDRVVGLAPLAPFAPANLRSSPGPFPKCEVPKTTST